MNEITDSPLHDRKPNTLPSLTRRLGKLQSALAALIAATGINDAAVAEVYTARSSITPEWLMQPPMGALYGDELESKQELQAKNFISEKALLHQQVLDGLSKTQNAVRAIEKDADSDFKQARLERQDVQQLLIRAREQFQTLETVEQIVRRLFGGGDNPGRSRLGNLNYWGRPAQAKVDAMQKELQKAIGEVTTECERLMEKLSEMHNPLPKQRPSKSGPNDSEQ